MASLWTPAEITTALWFDADDGGTITLDGSGNIEQWNDKSGNNRHASQSDSAKRPSLTDGKPDFDGSDDFLLVAHDAALNVSASQDFAIYAVNAPRSRAVNTIYAKGGVVSDELTIYYWEGDIRVRFDGTGFDKQFSASNGETITGLSRLGATARLWNTNPESEATGSAETAEFTTTKNVSIGAFDEGAGRFFDGPMSEIVVVMSGASDTLNRIIEGYLAHKWDEINGTTELVDALLSDHPFKSAAPLKLSGNAVFRESYAARLVRLSDLSGAVKGEALPEQDLSGLGDYEMVVGAQGPVELQAHAFDPEKWQGIWQASTVYAEGDIVFSNGATDGDSLVLEVTAVSGASESGGSEPTWDSTEGNTTTDNDLTWTTLGTVADLSPITNFHVAA